MDNKNQSVLDKLIFHLNEIESFAQGNKELNAEYYSMAISHCIQIANQLKGEERIQRMSDYTDGYEDGENKIYNLEKYLNKKL